MPDLVSGLAEPREKGVKNTRYTFYTVQPGVAVGVKRVNSSKSGCMRRRDMSGEI